MRKLSKNPLPKLRRRGKSDRSKIIAKLDKLYSDYVREKAGWKCARCGQIRKDDKRVMTCSHYFSRRNLSVRWELDNLDCLCLPCHLYQWESEKQGEYQDYMKKKLGKEGYERLEQKHLMTWKVSTRELELLYQVDKGRLSKLTLGITSAWEV